MFGINIYQLFICFLSNQRLVYFPVHVHDGWRVIPRHGDASMMLWDVHNCAPTIFPTDITTSWVQWRMQHTQQHNDLDILNVLSVNGASAAATTLSVTWRCQWRNIISGDDVVSYVTSTRNSLSVEARHVKHTMRYRCKTGHWCKVWMIGQNRFWQLDWNSRLGIPWY